MTEQKKEREIIILPEGRLINESLLERDQFNEQAKPSYKLELAFEQGVLNDVEDKLAEAAADEWGAGAYDEYMDNKIISPILSGNTLATRREEKGKPGEAYKGKDVIRAHTIYNKDGNEGPGGIFVCGPAGAEDVIGPMNREKLYQGCYGIAAVTIGAYIDTSSQKRALMFYLSGFQVTRDGEKLVSSRDYSKVFKPVGRVEGESTSRRRTRE